LSSRNIVGIHHGRRHSEKVSDNLKLCTRAHVKNTVEKNETPRRLPTVSQTERHTTHPSIKREPRVSLIHFVNVSIVVVFHQMDLHGCLPNVDSSVLKVLIGSPPNRGKRRERKNNLTDFLAILVQN
jgi:hypothetical protein